MAKPNNEKNIQPINKRLSIQIGLSGLSFSVLDENSNSVITLKHYNKGRNLTPFEMLDYLKYVLDVEQLTNDNYSKVTIIYRNELSTIVPKEHFSEEAIADYLKFNNKILATDFIAYDELVNDANVIYVPLININNYIFEVFGSFTYKHFSTLFIEYLTVQQQKNRGIEAFVHVHGNLFELLVLNDNTIIHHNVFTFSSSEDFIYYILFSFEQLKQDPEFIPLKLFGEISKESELFKIAYKYIRNVELGNYNFPFKVTDQAINTETNIALLTSFL